MLKCDFDLMGENFHLYWRDIQPKIVHRYSSTLGHLNRYRALQNKPWENLSLSERRALDEFNNDWIDLRLLANKIFSDVNQPQVEVDPDLRALILKFFDSEIQRYRKANATDIATDLSGLEKLLPPSSKRALWFKTLHGVKTELSSQSFETARGWLVAETLLGDYHSFTPLDLKNLEFSGVTHFQKTRILDNWLNHYAKDPRIVHPQDKVDPLIEALGVLKSFEVFFKVASKEHIDARSAMLKDVFFKYLKVFSGLHIERKLPKYMIDDLSVSLEKTLQNRTYFFGLTDKSGVMREKIGLFAPFMREDIFHRLLAKVSDESLSLSDPEFFIQLVLSTKKRRVIPSFWQILDIEKYAEVLETQNEEAKKLTSVQGLVSMTRFLKEAIKGSDRLHYGSFIPQVVKVYLNVYLMNTPIYNTRQLSEALRELVQEIQNLSSLRLEFFKEIHPDLIAFVFDRCLKLGDIVTFDQFLHKFPPLAAMWTGSKTALNRGYGYYQDYMNFMLNQYKHGNTVYEPDYINELNKKAGLFVAFDVYASSKFFDWLEKGDGWIISISEELLEWLVLYRPHELNRWIYHRIFLKQKKLARDGSQSLGLDRVIFHENARDLIDRVQSIIYRLSPDEQRNPEFRDNTYLLNENIAAIINWDPSVHPDFEPQDPDRVNIFEHRNTNH